MYQLRHTCAILLLAQGASLHEIGAILGRHSITLSSGIYTHSSMEIFRANADRMDRALG